MGQLFNLKASGEISALLKQSVRAASSSYREKGVEEWKQKKGTKALVNTKGKRVDGVEFLVDINKKGIFYFLR